MTYLLREKRRGFSPVLFAFLILASPFGVLAGEMSLSEKAAFQIKAFWPEEARLQGEKLKIKTAWKKEIEARIKQSFFRPELYFWKVFMGDSLAGYAVMDNVIGKTLPITFLLQFDAEGKILKSEVLKYREPYGGGVQSTQWNQQFEGRNADSTFMPGVNIDGISGATLSVRSMSKGVWKLALLVRKLREVP